MELLRGILGSIFGAVLSRFAGHNPMWSLAPLGMLAGAVAAWIVVRTSNRAEIEKIKRGMAAGLYELRLFAGEPALVLRAQWRLIQLSGAFAARMLMPAAILAILTLLIYPQLESFYAHQPLEIGQPAIVTLQSRDAAPIPVLRAPRGIAIDSPPVRADAGREVSWRIRALRPTAGVLEFGFASETITKSISAGTGPQYLSERRVSSFVDLLRYPAEPRLTQGPVNWILVDYPKASVHAFDMDLPWEVWFVAFSMLGAVVLQKRL